MTITDGPPRTQEVCFDQGTVDMLTIPQRAGSSAWSRRGPPRKAKVSVEANACYKAERGGFQGGRGNRESRQFKEMIAARLVANHVRYNDANAPFELRPVSPADAKTIKGWSREFKGKDSDPRVRDAIDFASSAVSRWESFRSRDTYAQSSKELQLHIQDNPRKEVACCEVMEVQFYARCSIIGIVHYRRSWKNNVILDYLSVHPAIAGQLIGSEVRGVGTQLLIHVARIARDLKSSMVWGEATPHSAAFYEKAFGLVDVGDLLMIPSANLHSLLEKVEQ